MHYEKFHDGTVKCVENEIPFEVPEGWEWERLGNVANIARGGSPRPIDAFITDDENGVNWIKIGDTEKDGKYISSTKEKIIPEGVSRSRYVHSGDFLLTNSMSFGRPYILRTNGCIHDGWLVIGDIEHVFDQDYLYYALSSSFMFQSLSLKAVGSTVKNLKSDSVKMILFPIPPFNEQKRIADYSEKLVENIDKISDSKDDLLLTADATKAKILDLAIRGKLVPQDENDEPASMLLEKIRSEKAELIKQGKLKRDKKESIIYKGDDNFYYQTGSDEPLDTPFDIPDTWVWSNLKELCNYGECNNTAPDIIPEEAWILDLEDIEKDTGKIISRYTNKERKTSSTKHAFKKDMVLYSKLRPYLNKVVLADDDGFCTSEIIPLKFCDAIYPRYAQLFLMSPHFVSYANHCSYGMKMPRLGTKDGQCALFAIPPYSEQRRIANMAEQLINHLMTIGHAIN